ncbi:MAG TPA: dTDP-4-dehydrorhamnose reductase [Gemmatimonadales bacterium]|nr:dTDP-4-dehydrorhamnose reductase [Gemmatimonadales bacterium]
MPTVLLFGATGQVGSAVARLLRGRQPCPRLIALSSAQADFRRPDSLRDLVRRERPDFIVNAAAYTAVDRAESEIELAHLINATAPGVLAEEAARIGASLLHYSTDYVFEGSAAEPYSENDVPNPLSAYGRSKLAGERAIAITGARHVIIRTSWVYSSRGSNFLLTMRRLFQERDEVRVVNDQYGAPTSAGFLAHATLVVLETALRRADFAGGVYHLTASGYTTWFGFAQRIYESLKSREPLKCGRVVPIATDEYPTPARRPRWSVLDSSKFQREFGLAPSSWQEQLDSVLVELQ